MNIKNGFQKGFTLIEIMVIAPIVILAIGAFITVIISMTGEVLAARGSNTLTYNVQDAINRIDQDVKLSTAFLAETAIPLQAADAQGYNDDATKFSNANGTNGTALILSMLVTNDNPFRTTAGIVYLKDQPNACASDQVQANNPMVMNVVYFVKGGTLWRRTIMPHDYPTLGCTTPWQQPSCSVDYTSTFCKTNDVKLVDGVGGSGLSVQYFSTASSSTANAAAVTGTDPAPRNVALSSTPTVGVSINASVSIAGRTIERSASLRSTRLETNASLLASTVATTPATPVLSSKVLNGESANFTWGVSAGGGNMTYDVDYNINDNPSWTSALTGTSGLTYSRIALRGQKVTVRVRATNSAGSSPYATTSVTIPLWNNAVLQNNWANYDANSYAPASFTKTDAGLVLVRGLIKRTGTAVNNEVIMTLPEGFRPATKLMFQLGNSNTSGRVFLDTNGDVLTIGVLDSGWLSLQDLSFIPTAAGYTSTTLTTVSPWVNYGPVYDPATSITDSTGRVNVIGLLKNGSTGSEVNMIGFAAGTTPGKRVYIPTPSATGSYGLIVADVGGFMKTALTSATYTGINSKFYPASRPDGTDCTISWCTLPMVSGWVPYGTAGQPYAFPQYTKGSDGLVMLRGLIKSGTTTGTMATLDLGYRPKNRMLFQVNAGAGYGRIDVLPTGVLNAQVTSATYTSLDNIYFMTD